MIEVNGKKGVGFRLPSDIEDSIKRAAEREGMTISDFIDMCLSQFLLQDSTKLMMAPKLKGNGNIRTYQTWVSIPTKQSLESAKKKTGLPISTILEKAVYTRIKDLV